MPTVSTMPPADRCFARLEKFQCACPNCGRVLTSHQLTESGALAPKKTRPSQHTFADANRHTWNPFTQRLACPWCRTSYVVGMVFYPAGTTWRTTDVPPDVTPTKSERLELRRLAGGYVTDKPYLRRQPVNLRVKSGCSCPRRGVATTCAVHGSQAPEEGTPAEGVKSEILGSKS